MSPLTALFLGVAAVLVSTITCASIIAIYGINVGDRWGGQIIRLADNTIQNLPETIEALPDAIGDLVRYRRAPDYAEHVEVAVELAPDPRGDGSCAVVTVENRGEEMITLLALRLKAINRDGVPIRERTEYAATPLMIDHDCRGPIMPNSKTRFPVRLRSDAQAAKSVEWEVADVWLWPSPEDRDDPDVD
jgi:hypothetical protein